MRHQSTASEGRAAYADELFRSRLDGQIDLRHPLAKLAQRMPWAELEEALSITLPPAPVAGGRPALPVRLMAGLLYLKHAYDLSDEDTCRRWLENPYWQFFTGEVVFQTRLPCDPSSLTRWRQRLGEAGMEELLAQTIAAARSMKAISTRDLQRVIVDSTVQEKAVAHPTDSRLLEVGRKKLVLLAKRHDIALRQRPKDKGKLYALHAPEVECIGKGKARKPYEFGVKVGLAVTARKGLIVGARSFPGTPYDGDTLAEQLEQVENLTTQKPTVAIVDLGYCGREVDGVESLHRGKPKRLTRRQWAWVKRRQAIEPVIGHVKDDCGMRRCHLKGAIGDALHAIACAAGYNIRWLMRWIVLFCAWLWELRIDHVQATHTSEPTLAA